MGNGFAFRYWILNLVIRLNLILPDSTGSQLSGPMLEIRGQYRAHRMIPG
jgi:hypothetical protein